MVHLVWILGWIEFHLAPFWCSTIFISCSAIFRVCTVSLNGENSVTGEISKFSSAQAKLGKQWNTQHSNQPNIDGTLFRASHNTNPSNLHLFPPKYRGGVPMATRFLRRFRATIVAFRQNRQGRSAKTDPGRL